MTYFFGLEEFTKLYDDCEGFGSLHIGLDLSIQVLQHQEQILKLLRRVVKNSGEIHGEI
jgi:hypothetical protein